MRMFTLAEVAARTDDRTLLLETVSEARDAYPTVRLPYVAERRVC